MANEVKVPPPFSSWLLHHWKETDIRWCILTQTWMYYQISVIYVLYWILPPHFIAIFVDASSVFKSNTAIAGLPDLLQHIPVVYLLYWILPPHLIAIFVDISSAFKSNTAMASLPDLLQHMPVIYLLYWILPPHFIAIFVDVSSAFKSNTAIGILASPCETCRISVGSDVKRTGLEVCG